MLTQETILTGLAQRLESLERAGVTHMKKASKPTTTPRGKKSPGAPSKGDKTLISRAEALALVAQDVAKCTRCVELAQTRTQTVFGVGNPDSELVFCGEAPGADEDRQGVPFVGRAGQLLTDIITKGMKLRREDVYILNILRCRPPGNRTPLPVEAAACREYLDRQLAIIQPKYICCLGAVAAQNLLGTDTPIGRLRGVIHDFHGIKVLCTYHPAYLLRNPSAKRYVWDDIQILMAEMKK
jgi:DNA polymerase